MEQLTQQEKDRITALQAKPESQRTPTEAKELADLLNKDLRNRRDEQPTH